MPELASDLERLPVDLVVAQGAAVEVISKLKLKTPVVMFLVAIPHPQVCGKPRQAAREHDRLDLHGRRIQWQAARAVA